MNRTVHLKNNEKTQKLQICNTFYSSVPMYHNDLIDAVEAPQYGSLFEDLISAVFGFLI